MPHLIPTPTMAAPARAPEIRFALIGEVTDHNVWMLFDGRGYSYNNYAVRARYWPRLYGTSPPDQVFEAVTASGLPTEIRQEGIFHTATVPLRTDLRWTDGAPFTAQDVAFTVNAALKFDLGFDWHDYYDPKWLDHAEAVAPDTVKFFFKRAPSVQAWQYGALQGPVVQERFWSSRVAAAAESLPPDDLRANMEALSGKIATLQQEVNGLYAATLAAQSEQARELQADLKRKQGDLDEATNDLTEAEEALQKAMNDARLALSQENDDGEPLLGGWLPADDTLHEAQAGATIVNVPNHDFPGPAPSFDRAVYHTYETREAAARALAGGEIDVILDPLPHAAGGPPSAMISPTRSMRFLVFNLDSRRLGDPSLRQALACMIDQQELAGLLGAGTAPLVSFVERGDGSWYSEEARMPCTDLDAASRAAQAVEILKAHSYTWERDPAGAETGQGLRGPDGAAVPEMQLLAPASDELRMAAAAYVEQRGLILGIPLNVKPVPADVVDYAVLSSGDYDMAVVGWRASPYPGYLCDWFSAGGDFHYEPTSVTSLCGELAATSDLDKAFGLAREIQRILANEVPMVPLYSPVTTDSFRNVSYPFAEVLDGLAGVYGAPELAIPETP